MCKKFFYPSLIIFLTGVCLSLGWHHHHLRPFSAIDPKFIPAFDPREKLLNIQAKALSRDDSKKLLGFDLQHKGILPVQFTIQNNSPNAYWISMTSIDLEWIDHKKVASTVRKSSFSRSIGFRIFGFMFWPMMIPGAIDSIHTFRSNKSMMRDYEAKAVKNEIIPVYSTINRILFVPALALKKEFTVSMIEQGKLQPWIATVSIEETVENPEEHVELDSGEELNA